VGHTNLDHFFHVEKLPAADRTVPLQDREVRLGGTAANIARVAAKLGVRTALVSQVGPDFPSRFHHLLVHEGVDLTGFETVEGARSPACFIVESAEGEQVTLIDQGPMENDRGAPVPTPLLTRSGWVHLATGNPDYQLRVLHEARRLGLRVAADPAQEIYYRWDSTMLRRLLSGSELFFANRHELARALELLHLRRVPQLLEVVPTVVETRGAKGAIGWTRTGPVHVAAVGPKRIRQVTGAGDGFRGGFYAGWFRGEPLRECLRSGAWAAARWLETGDPSALRRRGGRIRPPPNLSLA
jgi:nucleoside kinase